MRNNIAIFICLFFVTTSTYGQAGIIVTVVGNVASGHSGDGGPATAAGVATEAASLVFDRAGNYYFCERFDHVVRKVSISGIISTIAGIYTGGGSGSGGYSGDGGPATAARLNNPAGLAIDSAGNIFIGEIDGGRIRKINAATGIITTIAGNGSYLVDSGDGRPATSAAVMPVRLCFDKHQNLYFTTAGCGIRKIDAATTVITTIVPNTSSTSGCGYGGDGGPASAALINQATGICTDSTGDLFVADFENCRIRKISITTGIITTFAGNGVCAYNGEGLTATSSRIHPTDLKFDNNGNLIFGEKSNCRMRKITPLGYVYTIAGNGTCGYSGDGGVADSASIFYPWGLSPDECGNVYFLDNNNNRIRKISYNNNPSINITATTGNNPCYGMPVTFIAHPFLAGTTPVFQWKVNGANVGTSSPTYTYTPANGDSIQCILTSNLYCVTLPNDTSNTIHMSVDTLTPPTLSIAGDTVKGVGGLVNIVATITGTTGSYNLHWANKNVVFSTTTTPSVTYTKLAGTDTITASYVSSSRSCYDSVVSNVHLVYDHKLGIDDMSFAELQVTCFPNPAETVLHIWTNEPVSKVVITNILGQHVIEEQNTDINVAGLIPGMYFVRINNICNKTFIKK